MKFYFFFFLKTILINIAFIYLCNKIFQPYFMIKYLFNYCFEFQISFKKINSN